MINAYNADKNRVFPPLSLSINADKRETRCIHGKPSIHAGFKVYGDKNRGLPVFFRERIKRNIYICVVINSQSPYPCGFPVDTGLSALSATSNWGGYAV